MRNFLRGFVKLIAWLVLILVIIVAVLRIFFVDMGVVGHNGMAPTLVAGDEILIWQSSNLSLGDVTICRHPTIQNRFVVGRIVGKPGDQIASVRGQLTVNNRTADRDIRGTQRFNDTLNTRIDQMSYGIEKFGNNEHEFYERVGAPFLLQPRTVERGYFLLGDNRTHIGQDSRFFGEVDPQTCLGLVFMRFSPADPTGDDIKHGWFELIR